MALIMGPVVPRRRELRSAAAVGFQLSVDSSKGLMPEFNEEPL
jgi:hypothetical protein